MQTIKQSDIDISDFEESYKELISDVELLQKWEIDVLKFEEAISCKR